MKILMVNKFLHANGGSETYIFKLGESLQLEGHEVEYFGMDHENRLVGNRKESYVSNMDFHTSKLKKILYPFQIVYSIEARKKIKEVLEDFKPDVVHLNNFNFQLTPSILYEIKKRKIPIVYTAHDGQLVCPNHLMKIPSTGEICERCLTGDYKHCIKHKCIHNSKLKSIIASFEAYLYKALGVYKKIDCIISPSYFLKEKLSNHPDLKGKITVMHNFIEKNTNFETKKESYVLYFGRYSEEKGMGTLLEVCKTLEEIPFVFCGTGPLEQEVESLKNVKNLGFQSGEALYDCIRKAKFSVFPSECNENCPFTVMESQAYGTPVIGSRLGGTIELIEEGKTGLLFSHGNKEELEAAIKRLYFDTKTCESMQKTCRTTTFDSLEEYHKKLLKLYQSVIERVSL